MSHPRSLNKDKPDMTALHSPKWREELDVPVKSLGEQVPFFYTRAGAVLPLEGQYRGGHAFLIANGPSLLEIDMAPLKARWCMTLNNGARTFRGNANCMVDDPSRFCMSMWLDPTIQKFSPMSHYEKPLWDNRLVHDGSKWVQRWEPSKLKVGDCPNTVGYRRNEKYHAPRWLHEETINWGNHGKFGGGRSVLLAALRILFLLGFRHVYLLGVDFEMTAEKRYHFDEGRTTAAVKGNMETYVKLQTWFKELQPFFLQAGFIVKNCNATSKLMAFPHLPYEEALAESYARLGDPAHERTEGMYMRPGEKSKEQPKSEGAASPSSGQGHLSPLASGAAHAASESNGSIVSKDQHPP